jgi:hypothetical protein
MPGALRLATNLLRTQPALPSARVIDSTTDASLQVRSLRLFLVVYTIRRNADEVVIGPTSY